MSDSPDVLRKERGALRRASASQTARVFARLSSQVPTNSRHLRRPAIASKKLAPTNSATMRRARVAFTGHRILKPHNSLNQRHPNNTSPRGCCDFRYPRGRSRLPSAGHQGPRPILLFASHSSMSPGVRHQSGSRHFERTRRARRLAEESARA